MLILVKVRLKKMFQNSHRMREAGYMFHRAQIVGMILSYRNGKRCASCLTCSDEALERRSNDFTRIGTFEIISNHYYELI